MVKTLFYLFITSASFLLVGCHSYVEVVKLKPYKAKDFIIKELDVYEPEEQLFPVLDSIIIKAEECPEYQNRKEKLTFSISFDKGSFLGPEEEQNNPLLGISVRYYLARLSNYRWTEGVFNYKGYDFYVNGVSVGILLKKTDKTFSIECIDPEKYQFDILYRGDRDMYWWYRYKHGKLVNIQYGYCPKPYGNSELGE